MVFVEPVQPPLAYLVPLHVAQVAHVISAVAVPGSDMYLPDSQEVEWAWQSSVSLEAHVLPVQAGHVPAAVALAPVKRLA